MKNDRTLRTSGLAITSASRAGDQKKNYFTIEKSNYPNPWSGAGRLLFSVFDDDYNQ
ncbi:hypothetical protein [Anaerobacillus alkaliphilus]|uniref:hypothetical protein n=1 Tax=Anaerobacillus alkaliphilus TaxID=1548597 RepID=UPI0013757932|nr:hypothetical protein [Anaerobacillus alkaliphilus]